MKKGPIILLVMAMSLTMSVAANIHKHPVTVVYDVGDTKVVKSSDLINITPVVDFNLLPVAVDYAVINDQMIMKPLTSTSVSYKKENLNLKRKLYLLNCSIRQCSGEAVAAANSLCNS